MLIVAKKVHPRRILLCAVLLAAAAVCGGVWSGLCHGAGETQTTAGLSTDPKGIRSDEDRVAYLESWGWLVSEEPASVEEILIPEILDGSYQEYLDLQKSQGFDLTAYAGKTVKRYTYAVHNYPGLQENIWASLLMDKKTVIGGEIFCSQGDGFTQGLAYPRGTATENQGA